MTKRIFKIVALIIFCLYLTTGVAGASEIEDTLTTGIQSGVGSMDGILKSAPTASPVAGSYTSSQSVSLTAAGSTAICYTTNSTTPVCSSSIACSTGSVYSSALSVSSTTTIKSIACYADSSSGDVSSFFSSVINLKINNLTDLLHNKLCNEIFRFWDKFSKQFLRFSLS